MKDHSPDPDRAEPLNPPKLCTFRFRTGPRRWPNHRVIANRTPCDVVTTNRRSCRRAVNFHLHVSCPRVVSSGVGPVQFYINVSNAPEAEVVTAVPATPAAGSPPISMDNHVGQPSTGSGAMQDVIYNCGFIIMHASGSLQPVHEVLSPPHRRSHQARHTTVVDNGCVIIVACPGLVQPRQVLLSLQTPHSSRSSRPIVNGGCWM